MSDYEDYEARAELLRDEYELEPGWNRGKHYGEKRMCQRCFSHRHGIQYEVCYQCSQELGFKRDEFTQDQRVDIMERDGYQCQQCLSTDYLQIDHIMPCSLGGCAMPWNGHVLCSECNIEKWSNWWNGAWPMYRIKLMHFYFTLGWKWLSQAEQKQLIEDASEWGNDVTRISETGYTCSRALEDRYRDKSEAIRQVQVAIRGSQVRGCPKIVLDELEANLALLQAGKESLHHQQVRNYEKDRRRVDEFQKYTNGDPASEFGWHAHFRPQESIADLFVDEADKCPDECDCLKAPDG